MGIRTRKKPWWKGWEREFFMDGERIAFITYNLEDSCAEIHVMHPFQAKKWEDEKGFPIHELYICKRDIEHVGSEKVPPFIKGWVKEPLATKILEYLKKDTNWIP